MTQKKGRNTFKQIGRGGKGVKKGGEGKKGRKGVEDEQILPSLHQSDRAKGRGGQGKREEKGEALILRIANPRDKKGKRIKKGTEEKKGKGPPIVRSSRKKKKRGAR